MVRSNEAGCQTLPLYCCGKQELKTILAGSIEQIFMLKVTVAKSKAKWCLWCCSEPLYYANNVLKKIHGIQLIDQTRVYRQTLSDSIISVPV